MVVQSVWPTKGSLEDWYSPSATAVPNPRRQIDGCRRLGVLFRILLPLTRPALAVVAIFNFTWAWNEFFTPLIYLNSPKLFPITFGLHRFIGRAQIDIQFLMAMTIVSTLSPIAIFFLTQRYFIQGIVITGIKG